MRSANDKGNRLAGARRGRGFSLVELMVAMALGLFLTGGIITVFIGSKQSFNTQAGLSQIQQSARFAFDIIGSEVRMAGFMGCFSGTTSYRNTLNVDPPPFTADLSKSLYGYDGLTSGTWTPALTGVPGDVTDDLAEGTDVIVLRRVSDVAARLDAKMPDSSADLKIDEDLDPAPFEDFDIVLISDCTKSAIFQVTNYTNSSGNVVHNEGVGDPGNKAKELTGTADGFDTDASVFKIESRVFFIAEGAGINNEGNTYNSLWVKVGANAPVELVPGIEDLQILYGEDMGTDGVPDRFVTAAAVTDFLSVYSVKVRITATSVDSVGQAGVLQQSFETSIKLRNRGA